MRTKEKRDVVYGSEARTALLAGVEKTAKAVACTLGPKGRHVVIENQYQLPHVTKDGVSVASQFALKDPLENMGSHMLQEAAGKAYYLAGDGTTTATVLGAAIVKQVFNEVNDKKFLGLRFKQGKNINLVEVKKGIDAATSHIVAKLQAISRPASPEMVVHVATVSANGDKTIGNVVGTAINTVGPKGAVVIAESEKNLTEVTFTEGYQLNSGWFDKVFINNTKAMSCDFEDAKVLIVAEVMNKVKDLEPFMKNYRQDSGPLVIIAEGFQGEVLASMIASRQEMNSPVCIIKAPSIGQYRKNFMEDLALYTGATVMGDDYTHRLKQFKMDYLGSVEKVMISQNKATFVNGAGDEQKILNQIEMIDNLAKEATESEKKHCDERTASLKAKVANIYVASGSNMEHREVMDRIDDSIKSARAALDEGVVPGGGTAFIKCLMRSQFTFSQGESFDLGYEAVLEAIKAPFSHICKNAGVNPEGLMSQISISPDEIGYNAASEKMCNLIQEGIVDPTKVARVALESAASVAGAIITTECVMSFAAQPDKRNEPQYA